MAISESTIAKPANQSPEAVPMPHDQVNELNVLLGQHKTPPTTGDQLVGLSRLQATITKHLEAWHDDVYDSFEQALNTSKEDYGQFLIEQVEEATLWHEGINSVLCDYIKGKDDQRKDKYSAAIGFIAGMVFAQKNPGRYPLPIPEKHLAIGVYAEEGSMAAATTCIAEKIRSLARAHSDAITEMNSSPETEQESVECNEVYKRHSRTLYEFLGALPVFDFSDLDLDTADGLACHILTARVKKVANA